MTSLSHSILSEDKPPKSATPVKVLTAQQPTTDASKPSEQIATTSQSLQSSSISSIPQRKVNEDDDDTIHPAQPNGFHDLPPSPLRRRRTRGATISEHTEAWDKSYVFSFGISILRLYFYEMY
jgi:hypothetical protein